MSKEDLIQLVDQFRALPKENEWIEFKSGTATTHEKLGQYISGISNAACIANQAFGYLIFGIDDNSHDVIGTTFNFKTQKKGNEELELWISKAP